MVLALVEEGARLLPLPEVRPVAYGPLADDDAPWDLTGEHAHGRIEALAPAGERVGPQEDAGRGEQIFERGDHPPEALLHGRGAYLHDEVLAVAVHHKAGDEIGLG